MANKSNEMYNMGVKGLRHLCTINFTSLVDYYNNIIKLLSTALTTIV